MLKGMAHRVWKVRIPPFSMPNRKRAVAVANIDVHILYEFFLSSCVILFHRSSLGQNEQVAHHGFDLVLRRRSPGTLTRLDKTHPRTSYYVLICFTFIYLQ
jgi:hypothetical protein